MAEMWEYGGHERGVHEVVKAGNKPGSWVADFRRKETALEIIAAHNADAALVEALRALEETAQAFHAVGKHPEYFAECSITRCQLNRAALASLTPGEPAREQEGE